ncbi:hypothetical protein C8J57DRAFT_1407760 [Mycena rebaudengoi]|nr:hypothetical protein C8J57DRAFT_1407760 [Mycena rebaudengoi]
MDSGGDSATFPLEQLWPYEYGELIDDATSSLLPVLKAPTRSMLSKSSVLRLLSLTLHLILVGLHLGLIFIWAFGPGHRLLVSVERQWIVSLLITISSTFFTTLYLALLVFVTQTLSMRRDLQIRQTLTATHDKAAAWAGLGSALFYIWQQRAVSASTTGVLMIACYLTNIALLHVSVPNVILLQSVNISHPVLVATKGLPFFPPDYTRPITHSPRVVTFTRATLQMLPLVLKNADGEGLHEGTLYDVLEPNDGSGNVTVNATGFNISCRFFPEAHRIAFDVYHGRDDELRNRSVALDSRERVVVSIPPLVPNIIQSRSSPTLLDESNPYHANWAASVFMHTTIPIVDSGGNFGPMLNFTPAVQTFRCFQSLIPQSAIIDAKSRKVLEIRPSIYKTSSAWIPSTTESDQLSHDFIDTWGVWYGSDNTEFPQRISPYSGVLSVADVYLIQKFNLVAADASKRPSNVALHDLENALSTIVAAMFWTVGHVSPTYGSVVEANIEQSTIETAPEPPILLPGNATVLEITSGTRLNARVAVGFAASTVLIIVSLRYSLNQKQFSNDEDLAIDGAGILHTIWLYRNHPDLDKVLTQVSHPSNDNLRQAGMVTTDFCGLQLRQAGTALLDFIEDSASNSHPHQERERWLHSTPTRGGAKGQNTPQHSADTLTHELREPKSFMQLSLQSLRLASWALHLTLIGMHSVLLFMWARGPEYRLGFSIYSSLLVFISQTLSTRRDLQIQQPLTTTHDNAAAWAGLGSATLHIWNQRAVWSSITGVLSAFLFLGHIALLQIAMPNVILLQVVTANRTVVVETEGLPSYPLLYRDASKFESSDLWDPVARGSLYSLPSVLWNADSPGLHEGSLYALFHPRNAAAGNVTVEATGFNITCNTVPEAHIMHRVVPFNSVDNYQLALDAAEEIVGGIPPTGPNIISHFNPVNSRGLGNTSLYLYSTIPIVDSSGTGEMWLKVTRRLPPVQPFRCTQSLVRQKAVIDAKSRKVLDIQPSIHKTSSTWTSPLVDPDSTEVASANPFIESWGRWYSAMPGSELPHITVGSMGYDDYVSVADLHLIQQFNLIASDVSKRPSQISLHDLENALSRIVAGMFWSLGHVAPFHDPIIEESNMVLLVPPPERPTLAKGSVTLSEVITEICLDILAGLIASIELARLSLRYSLYHGIPKDASDAAVDGIGILHTIWLYRDHPELKRVLLQIGCPTDTNLRRAGMVHIRLSGQMQKPQVQESFDLVSTS